MRFSQRAGISPAIKVAQREAIDDELRASLWSLLSICYWDTYRAPGSGEYGREDFVRQSNLENLVACLWLYYFKKPIDTIEKYWPECLRELRAYFFSARWFQVYDFVEFVAEHGPKEARPGFVNSSNVFLERENSAYRFVGEQISEITSAEEIEEVERALAASDKFAGVKTHLTAALALLSSRTQPNYRNSIKESISAVEALAARLSGNNTGTLGSVLKELERSKKLHPALKAAFSALYGYTSDADGIRHALLEEDNLSKADARFMLICCSAFVNYAIENVAASE